MASYLDIGSFITVKFDKGNPIEVEWKMSKRQKNGLSIENLRSLVEDRLKLCGFDVKVETPIQADDYLKAAVNGNLEREVQELSDLQQASTG